MKEYKIYLGLIISCMIVFAATIFFYLPNVPYAVVIIGFIVHAIVIKIKNRYLFFN
jgi:hypothetical protein